MKIKNVIPLSLLICLFFACTSVKKNVIESNEIVDETIEPENRLNRTYLTQKQLSDYLDRTEVLSNRPKLPSHFDTIEFNKVIAYDFDGLEERHRSIISNHLTKFSTVAYHQKALNTRDLTFLTEFITDNKTYGESPAACFEPHLGIVFFKDKEVKYVIDVCLDCNSLRSTIEIPATQFKKVTYDDGSQFGLHGFSAFGKKKIVAFSKRLGLDYGDIKIE